MKEGLKTAFYVDWSCDRYGWVGGTYDILITAYIRRMEQIDFTSSLILGDKLYGNASKTLILETPLLGTQRQSYACSNRRETKGKEQQRHVRKSL